MIVIRVISGLGNQLFQYAVGRQLALMKQTTLKLDIGFYDSQQLRKYRLNHFNIEAPIATAAEIDSFLYLRRESTLKAKAYRTLEQLIPTRGRSYFKEKEWWVYEPRVYELPSHVYLDGYWQHFKYFEGLHPVIFKELSLKDTAEYQNNSYCTSIKDDPASVSIHIRRSDYISDSATNELMGVLPLTYYHQAISEIMTRISSPSFYIFSDDLIWSKDHIKIDAPVTFVDIDGGQKDYLELDLMSKCKHHIIANSSFSWWGAFLSQNPGKVVVAPEKWVRDDRVNSKINLQFPSWITI